MKGRVLFLQTKNRAQFFFLAHIKIYKFKIFIHRLTPTITYLPTGEFKKNRNVEENFDAETTEKPSATHMRIFYFQSPCRFFSSSLV